MRAALLGLVLLGGTSALACSCVPSDAVAAVASGEELRVFTGRVVRVIEWKPFGEPPLLAVAVLEVGQVWSGTVFRHTLVSVRGGPCGLPANLRTVGAEHLLVTELDEAWIGSSTSTCMGNEELSKAGPTLSRLGPGRRPLPDGLVGFPILLLLLGVLVAARRALSRQRRLRSS